MPDSTERLKVVYRVAGHLHFTVTGEGLVTISRPLNHPIQRAGRKLGLKIPPEQHTELDRFGSFIWQQLDGHTTVQQIGQRLEREFGKEAQPVYGRLLPFLTHLHVNLHYIEQVNGPGGTGSGSTPRPGG